MAKAATDAGVAAVGPRLAPEERRRHLIDVASAVVVNEGMAALSMERVAERAGVSRGLMYAYFKNRAGVVRALWAEVADRWGGDPMPTIPDDASHEELLQLFEEHLVNSTRWYFDMIEDGGVLFHRLMSEPDLEQSVEDLRHRILSGNVAWWAGLAERLGLDPDRALVWSTVFNGATDRMWVLVAQQTVDRRIVENVFYTSATTSFRQLLAETDAERDGQRS